MDKSVYTYDFPFCVYVVTDTNEIVRMPLRKLSPDPKTGWEWEWLSGGTWRPIPTYQRKVDNAHSRGVVAGTTGGKIVAAWAFWVRENAVMAGEDCIDLAIAPLDVTGEPINFANLEEELAVASAKMIRETLEKADQYLHDTYDLRPLINDMEVVLATQPRDPIADIVSETIGEYITPGAPTDQLVKALRNYMAKS